MTTSFPVRPKYPPDAPAGPRACVPGQGLEPRLQGRRKESDPRYPLPGGGQVMRGLLAPDQELSPGCCGGHSFCAVGCSRSSVRGHANAEPRRSGSRVLQPLKDVPGRATRKGWMPGRIRVCRCTIEGLQRPHPEQPLPIRGLEPSSWRVDLRAGFRAAQPPREPLDRSIARESPGGRVQRPFGKREEAPAARPVPDLSRISRRSPSEEDASSDAQSGQLSPSSTPSFRRPQWPWNRAPGSDGSSNGLLWSGVLVPVPEGALRRVFDHAGET